MRRTAAMVQALQRPDAAFADFHLAVRSVKDVPAPTNLEIPDYRFISITSVKIG
jgi:hypothetical protein